MANLVSPSAEQVALQALGGVANYFSLHTGVPCIQGNLNVGQNEVPTGSGYNRVAVSWTALNNTMSNPSTLTLSVPSGNTVSYFGTFNGSGSGANFSIGGLLTTALSFPTAGTITFAPSSVTVTATG
jgi:hypothetical protein